MRELENAVALSVDGVIDVSLLPGGAPGGVEPAVRAGLKERVGACERGLIVAALEGAKGNRSEAARLLDISRATLHDKLRKYGLAAGDEDGA